MFGTQLCAAQYIMSCSDMRSFVPLFPSQSEVQAHREGDNIGTIWNQTL